MKVGEFPQNTTNAVIVEMTISFKRGEMSLETILDALDGTNVNTVVVSTQKTHQIHATVETTLEDAHKAAHELSSKMVNVLRNISVVKSIAEKWKQK